MIAAQIDHSKLLIRNARLIDGTGASPQEGVSILISDGRIVQIGREIAEQGAQEIDARDLTVLPGLIDAHVHLYSVPGTICRGDSLEVIRRLQRVH